MAEARKFSIIVLSILISLSLTSCETITPLSIWRTLYPRGPELPTVLLTHNDIAYRSIYLLEDAGMKSEILPRTDLPYSDNASGAIWIGVNFPFQDAQKAIKIGVNYYKELHYVAFSTDRLKYPEDYSQALILGGSTDEAMQLGLKAWTTKELETLLKASTREEFKNLVHSHYNR